MKLNLCFITILKLPHPHSSIFFLSSTVQSFRAIKGDWIVLHFVRLQWVAVSSLSDFCLRLFLPWLKDIRVRHMWIIRTKKDLWTMRNRFVIISWRRWRERSVDNVKKVKRIKAEIECEMWNVKCYRYDLRWFGIWEWNRNRRWTWEYWRVEYVNSVMKSQSITWFVISGCQ